MLPVKKIRDTTSGSPHAAPPRPRRRRRWLALLGIGLCVVLLVGGLHWLVERPVRLAEAALDQGQPERALTLVTDFLADDPRHGPALAVRARALVALGKPQEAIRIFDRIGAAEANELHAWARAYLMQSQWSPALPLLQRVVDLEPDNADALYEITTCRVRLGHFEEALKSASRFAAVPGNEARGQLFIGSIHNDMDNHRQALDAYAKTLEYEPDGENLQVPAYDFFLEYGRSWLRAGDPKRAIDPLERSLTLNPTPEADLLLGNALAQLGKMPEAEAAWQRVVRTVPDHAAARDALADVALQRGSAQAALEWLAPLASSADLRASTAYLFQRAHTLAGNEKQAAEWQQKTAELREKEKLQIAIETLLTEAPQSFWAQVIRAYRFALAGNWSQAEAMMEVLRQQAPEEPFVADLAASIGRRGPLPPLSRLPIKQF